MILLIFRGRKKTEVLKTGKGGGGAGGKGGADITCNSLIENYPVDSIIHLSENWALWPLYILSSLCRVRKIAVVETTYVI